MWLGCKLEWYASERSCLKGPPSYLKHDRKVQMETSARLRSLDARMPIICKFRKWQRHAYVMPMSSVFFGCTGPYTNTLGQCLRECLRMPSLRGLERVPTPEVFYIICLRDPTRVPSQGSLLDGHVLGKWRFTFISQFRHPNTAIRQ